MDRMTSYSLIIVFAVTAISASSITFPRFPNPSTNSTAPIKSHPYQISFEVSDPKLRFLCGGVIVSELEVIGAAHCFSKDTSNLVVRAGSSHFNRGGHLHPVARMLCHESYDYNMGYPVNDIAVLRLAEPFRFDEEHQPIRLFQVGEQIPGGAGGVVTEWGWFDQLLRGVGVGIVERESCDMVLPMGLAGGQICGERDFSRADSGGALVVGGRLAGIVSVEVGKLPVVFTEIAAYRDWIDKHLGLPDVAESD